MPRYFQMLLETMSHPAHADSSSFSVPCKHCAALLHAQERICPYCGYDQGAPDDDGGAHALSEFESPDTLPPITEDQTLILPRHGRRKPPGRAVVAAAAAPITVRPSRPAYPPPETFWQKEEPARSPLRWVGGLAISFLAALVLFALTLALDYFYFDRRTEPGRARAFQADLAEVRGALSRGDLGAAERTLDAMDADHEDNPNLLPLREELDRRVQEQEVRRAQLRDAARKASQALGLAQPAPPTDALPVADAPEAPPPAATGAAPDADGKPCDEALAALALCSRDASRAP